MWVVAFVVDAADHGVPQHRRRLLLIGTRAGGARFSPPATRTPPTVREALRSLGPPDGANGHAVLGIGVTMFLAFAEASSRPYGHWISGQVFF